MSFFFISFIQCPNWIYDLFHSIWILLIENRYLMYKLFCLFDVQICICKPHILRNTHTWFDTHFNYSVTRTNSKIHIPILIRINRTHTHTLFFSSIPFRVIPCNFTIQWPNQYWYTLNGVAGGASVSNAHVYQGMHIVNALWCVRCWCSNSLFIFSCIFPSIKIILLLKLLFIFLIYSYCADWNDIRVSRESAWL